MPSFHRHAVIDFRRAHMDADHVGDLTTAMGAMAAWQARAVAMAQAGDEFTTQFTAGMGIDGGIDGFMRHVELALVRKVG